MGRRIIHACKEAQTGSAVQTFLKTVPAAIPKNGAEQPVETQLVADDYKMKVIKYISTEIIEAYVTWMGHQCIQSGPCRGRLVVFVILLVLTPLYVWALQSGPSKTGPGSTMCLFLILSYGNGFRGRCHFVLVPAYIPRVAAANFHIDCSIV